MYNLFCYKKSYNIPTKLIYRDVMNNLQTSKETSQICSLAVFILSHGEDNGTVFASDSMYRVDHDILYPLAADKCPLLAGKPKLIFVQACQGKVSDTDCYTIYILLLV